MSAAAITELLTRVMNGRALGVQRDGNINSNDPTFFHGGRHNAEARNRMCGNPVTGDGIVVLTNSDSPSSDDVVGILISDIIATYVKSQQSDDWVANADCM